MIRSTAVVLGLALWAASAPVHEVSADPPTDAEREARRLYEQGVAHYDRAEFDDAIANFKAAHALTSDPSLLFNIAQAYRHKGTGSCSTALDLFRQYEASGPPPARREELASLIAEMTMCAAKETPPAPAPAPAVATSPSDQETTHVPLLIGGVGATLVVAGAAVYWWGHSDYEAVKDTGCAPNCDPSSLAGVRAREITGGTLIGVGVATAGAALVWWLRQPRRPARLAIFPVAGGVVASGSF